MGEQPRASDLYHTDFYAWTQDQAARLRALVGDNRVDAEHLADEVADLGKAQRRAVESNLVTALVHLLKAAWSPSTEPQAKWLNEVEDHLDHARDGFDPSMRKDLAIEAVWTRAVRRANRRLADHDEPPLPNLPTPLVSLDELLDESVSAGTLLERVQVAIGVSPDNDRT